MLAFGSTVHEGQLAEQSSRWTDVLYAASEVTASKHVPHVAGRVGLEWNSLTKLCNSNTASCGWMDILERWMDG